MSPTVRERVASQRSILLKSIAGAAEAADSQRLLDLTSQLRNLEDWVARHDSLIVDAEALLAGAQQPVPIRPTPPNHSPPKATTNGHASTASGRSYGTVVRTNFIRSAASKGLSLSPYHGAVYKTPRGLRLGIAVATERQPNRWFLGLGQDDFDAAALLCHTTGGRTLELCLPSSFIRSHGQRLSRSGGQVKFNVTRRDGQLFLKIPRGGKVPIDQYLGAVSQLG